MTGVFVLLLGAYLTLIVSELKIKSKQKAASLKSGEAVDRRHKPDGKSLCQAESISIQRDGVVLTPLETRNMRNVYLV